MATLINGDGNAAVYAAQDADWFAGVEGNVTKILNIGLKMAYEIEDANTIAVKNGVIVTQEGRRIQIDAGSIDEFTIPTGSQGVTKYYIIGYHLYTDSSSNQLCETFVQLMANNTDTIPEDTFRGGSDEVYVSLYRVTQDGITLSTVQSLLPEAATIKDIEDDIAGINASLTELNSSVAIAAEDTYAFRSATAWKTIKSISIGKGTYLVIATVKTDFSDSTYVLETRFITADGQSRWQNRHICTSGGGDVLCAVFESNISGNTIATQVYDNRATGNALAQITVIKLR